MQKLEDDFLTPFEDSDEEDEDEIEDQLENQNDNNSIEKYNRYKDDEDQDDSSKNSDDEKYQNKYFRFNSEPKNEFMTTYKDDEKEKDNDTDDDDKDDEKKSDEPASSLDNYGTDITELARQGKLDDCFGREKELSELMEVLVRRQKNNPVLVGDAGVGKSAIVELFASKLVKNLVPFVLEGRSIISLDLARIVAGSRYRGEFEARFRKILDEAISEPNLIIFIDEIHTLSGTGSAEGSLDAANMLKPILARNGFQCIGATTTKEYETIERDPALHRRFQPIVVKEPSVEETISILYSLRAGLESFHNLEFSPGALKAAVELSHRYITDRHLPDKAIDIIDRTAAKEVIELTSPREHSIIGAIVNGALRQIGRLKNEAFRRGDMGSQYIFQELENAYRNFLFTWIHNPNSIPLDSKNKKSLRSPISQELFDQMRLCILSRTEDLIFASSKPRFVIQPFKQLEGLSENKAKLVLENFFYSLNSLKIINQKKTNFCWRVTSTYRISLFLFSFYQNFEQKIESRQTFPSPLDRTCTEQRYKKLYYYYLHTKKKKKYAASISISKRLTFLLKLINGFMRDYGFLSYIRKLRHFTRKTTQPIFENMDFFRSDVETIVETFEYLSELETIQTDIVEDFLNELKPIMTKALAQSFASTMAFKLTDQELDSVYNLLGYYSTETGKNFLASLSEPEALNDARKKGNFAGLKRRVGPSKVKTVLSYITGIPIESISIAEQSKLLNLEKTLHERVVGQEDAISAISRAIRRARLGIQNPNRPIASFFFCGPTGVGKTEVCKALAYTMFGSEKDMIRFDMSEFMEKFTLSRLIGSPPGYIGYEEGGQLSNAVRKKPYSVVLFDEVEKAHPDVLNILLQILEDGRLTDTQKRLIPFENTIIIMTSNVGAGEIQNFLKENPEEEREVQPSEDSNNSKQNPFFYENEKGGLYLDPYMGTVQFLKSPIKENFLADIQEEIHQQFKDSFKNISDYKVFQRRIIKQIEKELGKKLTDEVKSQLLDTKESDSDRVPKKVTDEKKNALKNLILQKLGEFFLPEFLNRLDDIVVFKPLKPLELRRICDFMIDEVAKRMHQKNIEIEVDQLVRRKLTKEGYNPAFGARPLRRLITKYIEDLVSENVLKSYNFQQKTLHFNIRLDDNNQIFIFNPTLMDRKAKKSAVQKNTTIDSDFQKSAIIDGTPNLLTESIYYFPLEEKDYPKLPRVNDVFLKALKANALKPFSEIKPLSDSEIQQYNHGKEEKPGKFFSLYDIFLKAKPGQQVPEVTVEQVKPIALSNASLKIRIKLAEDSNKGISQILDDFLISEQKTKEKSKKSKKSKDELVSV